MNDTRSQVDEKTLQEKIAAEFEKAARRASSDVSIRLLDPIGGMFRFVQDIQRQLSARATEAQQMAERVVATAREVAVNIGEAISEASDRFREVLGRSDHVAKLGWTLDPNFPFSEVFQLSTLTSRADADAYVLKWYEEVDPLLEHVERNLRGNRLLVRFDTLLRQCFDAFRRGDYAICISNLMNVL